MISVPQVEWLQHSTSIDPSGSRHLKSPVKGFIKQLGTGAGQQLEFGGVDISTSGSLSPTRLCFARVANFNGASGIYNLRFFINSASAFGAGTYRFLQRPTLHFVPNLLLSEADADTPTSIPSTPNIKGTIAALFPNGQGSISGLVDQDVSQYMYLGMYIGSDVPLGQYGGAGAGTFRYRLLFDFS